VVEWCACFGDRRCWLFGCLVVWFFWLVVFAIRYFFRLGDVSCRRKRTWRDARAVYIPPFCTVNPIIMTCQRLPRLFHARDYDVGGGLTNIAIPFGGENGNICWRSSGFGAFDRGWVSVGRIHERIWVDDWECESCGGGFHPSRILAKQWREGVGTVCHVLRWMNERF